jgi:TonB family protein
MRRMIPAALIGCALSLCLPARMLAQAQEPAQSTRKLIVKVTPVYPELARRINLAGKVKLLATVAPNGSVKQTEVFGGSPVLAQAAQNAVQKWKWQPASEETKETVEVNFHPD